MLELQEGLNLNLNIEPKDPLIDDSVLLPYLEELLSWGLVIGGYNNNFNLEEKISEREFAHIIIKGLKRKKAEILYEWVPGSLETLSTNNKLDLQNASKLLLAARSQRVLDMDNTLYLEKALEMDLLPLFIMDNINLKDFLTRRQAYIIIGYLLKKYPVDDRLKYIRRGYVCE